MATDKTLECCSCSDKFLFSADEQEFFIQKGLVNEPKRCPNCRILLRAQRKGKDADSTAVVACAQCTTPTRVPFQPKGYKPVYCSPCMRSKTRELAVVS